MRIKRIAPLAVGLLITLVQTGAAQDSTAAKPKTTMSGIYTLAQADRGKETFATHCSSCHTPDEHTGNAFLMNWVGKPLSEFFVYLATSMPKSDPGILSQKEYAQLIALLLKTNNMPAGEVELPEDSAQVRTIKFDTVKVTGPVSVLVSPGKRHAGLPRAVYRSQPTGK
jgi:mono/diheme cytochrome c family protein